MKNEYCPRFDMNFEIQNHDLNEELSGWGRARCTAFTKLRDIFTDKKTPPPVKADLFNSTMLPIQPYGCETWNIKSIGQRKLPIKGAMKRNMMGIGGLPHASNEDPQSYSGVKNVI